MGRDIVVVTVNPHRGTGMSANMSLREVGDHFEPNRKTPVDAILKKYKPSERHAWTLRITERMRKFVEADMYRPGRESMAPQMLKAYCDIIQSLDEIDENALKKLQLWQISEDQGVIPMRRVR